MKENLWDQNVNAKKKSKSTATFFLFFGLSPETERTQFHLILIMHRWTRLWKHETANVDYRLSFADQGKKLPYSVSLSIYIYIIVIPSQIILIFFGTIPQPQPDNNIFCVKQTGGVCPQ
jgi:hypothetical protein